MYLIVNEQFSNILALGLLKIKDTRELLFIDIYHTEFKTEKLKKIILLRNNDKYTCMNTNNIFLWKITSGN